MSLTTTRAPSVTKRRAVAAPMLPAAPEMKAILSWSRFMEMI
jgi:hypothetical protein